LPTDELESRLLSNNGDEEEEEEGAGTWWFYKIQNDLQKPNHQNKIFSV
jgi:hypothetical protein